MDLENIVFICNEILFHHKEESFVVVGKWVELENIILIEVI
jgi:hypothetical protein